MRHKSRTIFAALVAVFALGAIASASASAALPEFVHGEGESFPIGLSYSSNIAKSKFGGGSLNPPPCEGLTFKGEITGAKAFSLTAELKDCVYGGTNEVCLTRGIEEKNGKVVVSGSGSLVYIERATKKVGLLFNLNEAEITCPTSGVSFRIRGNIVIPVTPINTKTSSLKLTIHGSGGSQEFKTYENEKAEKVRALLQMNVSGTGFKEADWNVEGEPTLTTSKPVTVKG